MVLISIEYPLMLFLVMAGLDKMDVYHIVMLLAFIVYTLCPKAINDRPIVLLAYANFFTLEKYLYTLISNTNDPVTWMEILGLHTSFDPSEQQEYFRYMPKFDQWALVLLTFCLYRRQMILGTDD